MMVTITDNVLDRRGHRRKKRSPTPGGQPRCSGRHGAPARRKHDNGQALGRTRIVTPHDRVNGTIRKHHANRRDGLEPQHYDAIKVM